MRRFIAGTFAVAMAFLLVGIQSEAIMAHEEGDAQEYAVLGYREDEAEAEKDYVTKYTSGDYQYIINDDNTATIVSYKGADTVVTLPGKLDDYTVKGIGVKAFNSTKIVELTIPANITEIADGAFYYNEYMKSITVAAGNTFYESVDGVLFNEAKTELIAYPAASERTAYTVPNGVVRIGMYSFTDSSKLKSIVFADTVKVVGDHAFSHSLVASVDMGKGLTTIEDGGFRNGRLVEVVIPDSVTSIGNNAFRNNSYLKSIKLSKNLEFIGSAAIFECNQLTTINIPASVKEIEEGVIGDCGKLTDITVENGNKNYQSVDGVLFNKDKTLILAYPMGNEATGYVIPDTVTRVGDCAFYGADKLEEIIVPTSVTQLGNSAFRVCEKVRTIDLSYNITEMGTCALYGCKALEGIIVPAAMDEIDVYLFYECPSLKTIFIPSEVEYISAAAFSSSTKFEKVYYIGSEAQWEKVRGSSKAFSTAEIYYADNLKGFVERMYTKALNRKYDRIGLNVWVRQLIEETHDGAGLAMEFILGEEFALRNLSDEEYVDTLYATLFNREADAAGKELWVATLANGATREYVLSNFVNLPEFTLLCAEYDINRGVMFENGKAAAPGLLKFVGRLYETVLSRDADDEGLYVWSASLADKTLGADEVAISFFTSDEYVMKNQNSEAFVTDCYSVFMDREADAEGLAFWVACLEEQGVSREWVISEFAKSVEFKEIAAKYGL